MFSFFDSYKLLPQALLSITNWCKDNRSLMEARASSDKHFFTRLLLSVDERIYLWYKSCCRATNINDSKMELMNFGPIISGVESNKLLL